MLAELVTVPALSQHRRTSDPALDDLRNLIGARHVRTGNDMAP
ncbi:hypothetical protein RA2_03517 [Roseovarius sp. A-2]|nr:hypothetical protein [Roseovarius sp. A-2]GAW36447.1 hypothetical protein RA2_03517 [Roseovarius sp. A-2]